MRIEKKSRIPKIFRSTAVTFFLLTILMMSVATISLAPRNTQATTFSGVTDLCKTFGIGCTTTSPPPDDGGTSPPPPSTSGKFFLATFLQYVKKDPQVNIYKPNMGSEDITKLMALKKEGTAPLKSDYVTAAKNLAGPAGVEYASSDAIVRDAKYVKSLGFTFIGFDLEPGISPDSDNNDVVGAIKKAANAAHNQGLKFEAAPSKAYTTKYGSQIAPLADYYHIQAQSLQDNGIKAYSDYVHTEVSKLKKANSNLEITVQVSTMRGAAPDLTLLETMKQCVDSVKDVVDGATVYFDTPHLSTLKSFTQWYNTKY